MRAKLSEIRHIIYETISDAPQIIHLPDGHEVEFASQEHIEFIRDTVARLEFLRDREPTARKGGYRSAPRKIYGDAHRELKIHFKDLTAFLEAELAQYGVDENK